MSARKPKWAPIAVIAVDPGESAGVAILKGGLVLASGPAVGDKWRTLHATMARLVQESGLRQEELENTLGVVEQGFIVKGRGAKGTLTLAQRRGIAQSALEACGVAHVEFVHSSTWQNGYFGPLKKRDTKELATIYATTLLGFPPSNHDHADAVCLAAWSNKEFCR